MVGLSDFSGGSCVAAAGQVGATYGAGFHSFFNDFVALDFQVRDLLVKDNPAGRDVNADQLINKSDLTWSSHLMITIGATIYLPAKADISP